MAPPSPSAPDFSKVETKAAASLDYLLLGFGIWNLEFGAIAPCACAASSITSKLRLVAIAFTSISANCPYK
jgi:hypothetical protein